MRQTGRRRDRHRHAGADRELGPHRALAAERRCAEDRLHPAAALHREQPRKAERAGQPGQQRVLHIALAGEAEQLLVPALVDEPGAGVFLQIVVDVLVDDFTVYAVLLLQRAVGQQRIGREGARRDLLLRFEHRGELLALFFEPIITFLGKRP